VLKKGEGNGFKRVCPAQRLCGSDQKRISKRVTGRGGGDGPVLRGESEEHQRTIIARDSERRNLCCADTQTVLPATARGPKGQEKRLFNEGFPLLKPLREVHKAYNEYTIYNKKRCGKRKIAPSVDEVLEGSIPGTRAQEGAEGETVGTIPFPIASCRGDPRGGGGFGGLGKIASGRVISAYVPASD